MNFFGFTNFGTTFCLEALCPLAEPLPPNSAGAAGVESAGLTTEPIACLLEGEGGIRRGKAIKKKAITQKAAKTYSPVTTRRGSAPLPSLHRLDGRLIHRPLLDVRCCPTRRRTCEQESTTNNQGSKGNYKSEYKAKEIRCTLESVRTRGTSSSSGDLL